MIDPRTIEPMPPDTGTAPPAADAEVTEDNTPIPLAGDHPIPPFPVDALPPVIAQQVRELAEATQTDPAMAGTVALSVLAACNGGNAVIQVRRGWEEPLNLYAVAIADPGERKSPVQTAMVKPLRDAEKILVETGADARIKALTEKEVATRAAEDAKRNAGRKQEGGPAGTLTDAIDAVKLAEAIEIPPIPRLAADDMTSEAAASLLAEQGGRLAGISAEGGIFDIIAGRYSGNPNFDLWLKGHAGDPIRVDRRSRDPEYIESPALTLGLMVQPAVLDTIGENRQFRGRGLLARFLYAYPVSKVGYRKIGADPVTAETETAYRQAVTRLAVGMREWGSDPAKLPLTEAAHRAVLTIEQAVEDDLRESGELGTLKDWGSKYVGAVMRIAGNLHLAKHGADTGPRTPVDAVTVVAAQQIGNYFRACAVKAFSTMTADRLDSTAAYLWRRIKDSDKTELSERDMQRLARAIKTADELREAAARLVEHGHLIPLDAEFPAARSDGRGRPPSRRYRVWRAGEA